jgi:hypothetical protein
MLSKAMVDAVLAGAAIQFVLYAVLWAESWTVVPFGLQPPPPQAEATTATGTSTSAKQLELRRDLLPPFVPRPARVQLD